MEIKIHCDCGQKIKFDVEPLNGRMPWELTCPVCGASGTAKANQAIAQSFGGTPPAPAPIRIIPQIISTPGQAPATAPPPIPIPVPMPMATSQPTEAPKPRLAISRPTEPPLSDAPAPPRPMLAASAFKPTMGVKPKIENIFGEPDMKKTILGACIGSLIGVLIWWGMVHFTEMSWGIMAVAVGWFAGFSARWIGRSEGQQMGIVTALIALAAIISFQAWQASKEFTTSDKDIDAEYADQLKDAKKVMDAVPNGTDEEIKSYIISDARKLGVEINPAEISADDIKSTREDEWQPAKDLVSKTKEQFRKEYRDDEKEMNSTWLFRIIFWVMAIGLFNIVFIAIGVAFAYRFGSGEG